MALGLLAHEPLIRLGAFLGVFALMALWEALAPRRGQAIGRWTRWPNNLGVVVVDTIVVRVLFPTAAVGMALVAEERGWGLFNLLAGAVLGRRAHLGRPPRPRHLRPARRVPRRACPLAAAPDAPRRPRVRRDDRRALPSRRDRAVDADQVRRRRRPRRARGGRADLRGAAERHLDVQPRQRPPAGVARTASCAGSWSRPRCTGSTTRSCGARPTATSASTCPGGTACSAPTAPSPRPDTGDDDRHRAVPRSAGTAARPHAAATAAGSGAPRSWAADPARGRPEGPASWCST